MLRSKAGKQAKTYIDVLFYLPGDDLVIRTLALSHSALSAELGASALTGKQLLNPKGTLDLPYVNPTAPFKRSQEILVRCHLGESPEPCTEEIPHLAGSTPTQVPHSQLPSPPHPYHHHTLSPHSPNDDKHDQRVAHQTHHEHN